MIVSGDTICENQTVSQIQAAPASSSPRNLMEGWVTDWTRVTERSLD